MRKNKTIVQQMGLNGLILDYDSNFTNKEVKDWLNRLFANKKDVKIKVIKKGSYTYEVECNNQIYHFYIQKMRNYGTQNHNLNQLRSSLRLRYKQCAIDDYEQGIIPIFIALYYYYDKKNDFPRYIPSYIPTETILTYAVTKESSLSIQREALFDSLENKSVFYYKNNEKLGIKYCRFNAINELFSLVKKYEKQRKKIHTKETSKFAGKKGYEIESTFAYHYDREEFPKYQKWFNPQIYKSLENVFIELDKYLLEKHNDKIVKIVARKFKDKKQMVYDLITKNGLRISLKSCGKAKPTFCPTFGETCYNTFEEIYCNPLNQPLPKNTNDLKTFVMENIDFCFDVFTQKTKELIDYTIFVFYDDDFNCSLFVLDHNDIIIPDYKREDFRYTCKRKDITESNEWNYSMQIYYKDIQLGDFEIKGKGKRTGKRTGTRFRFYVDAFLQCCVKTKENCLSIVA